MQLLQTIVLLILTSFSALGFSQELPKQEDLYSLTIRFISDHEIPATESSRVKIKVWGFDRGVADVPATNIKTLEERFQLDHNYLLTFNQEELNKVEYQVGDGSEPLRYYFTFKIDLNGDHTICPQQDYIRDYDKSDLGFYSADTTRKLDLQIHIKVKSGSQCDDF